MAIWHDEGSTGGTAMALGGHDGPALLGGDKCKRLPLLLRTVPTRACLAPRLSRPNLQKLTMPQGSRSGPTVASSTYTTDMP